MSTICRACTLGESSKAKSRLTYRSNRRELILNLKTAKTFGITFPSGVLVIADKGIEWRLFLCVHMSPIGQ